MSSFHTATEFAVAFAAATFAVLALNPLARRLGWVDRPHGRKDHEVATPVTGGLAISIGVLLALPMGMTVPDAFYAFCLGSLVLLIVGILDDLLDLSWSLRLLAQCGAALIMVYLGNVRAEYIGLPGDPASIDLGIFTVPFTVFITIGIINAINMADGADGVAGGVTLVSLAMLGFVCERVGNYELLDRIVILAGAIAGFCVMNMRHPWQPRAQAFLGNSGSTIIGLAITWLTVRISHTAGHPVSSILGPWLVALPLIDCVVLMLRRVRQHRSPFSADRNHMHHLLLDAGFSPSQVALLLAGLTAVFGMSAMAAIYMHVPQIVLVVVFLILIGAHYAFTANRDRAVGTLHRLRAAIWSLTIPVSSTGEIRIVEPTPYRQPDGSRAKL
jgi:UDP-GlcNAc:undecaprenyl-phosphate GlcNAc-1-phosphate transferase